MIEINPPESGLQWTINNLFLGGSIEMGTAPNWQSQVVLHLKDIPGQIYNPRRPDWDDSWEQSINNLEFKDQVMWELSHLESCDKILFNFVDGTKSPITLMELGLRASLQRLNLYTFEKFKQKILVICPQGFWRKGNVDIVCERYGVRVENKFDLDLIKDWVNGCE